MARCQIIIPGSLYTRKTKKQKILMNMKTVHTYGGINLVGSHLSGNSNLVD